MNIKIDGNVYHCDAEVINRLLNSGALKLGGNNCELIKDMIDSVSILVRGMYCIPEFIDTDSIKFSFSDKNPDVIHFTFNDGRYTGTIEVNVERGE